MGAEASGQLAWLPCTWVSELGTSVKLMDGFWGHAGCKGWAMG